MKKRPEGRFFHCSRFCLLLRQHQLAIAHRDPRTRLTLHAHGATLARQLVADVVADHLLVGILQRLATGFGGGVGIVGLHALLRLVANVAAAHRTGHGGQLLAAAAADLVADQPTHHRADGGAGDLMLVLHGTLMGDGDLLADLARSTHGLLYRLHIQDGGELRLAITRPLISRQRSACRYPHRAEHHADEHRLLHYYLQSARESENRALDWRCQEVVQGLSSAASSVAGGIRSSLVSFSQTRTVAPMYTDE